MRLRHFPPVAALTTALSLGCVPAMAQTGMAPTIDCSAIPGRVSGLALVPTTLPLADFSIAIAGNQEPTMSAADAMFLEGSCAADVQSFRMSQIAFRDGAVFTARSDGSFVHSPGHSGLTTIPGLPVALDQPSIEDATFIMATPVDRGQVGAETRSLEVGLWNARDGYLVAAFIRHGSGFSTPVALVRSTQRLTAVTFFPAPDSNAGKLGLRVDHGGKVALVSLNWNHAALSKSLRAGEPD